MFSVWNTCSGEEGEHGFLFTREETFLHLLALSDVSLPQPNRSFNSDITDYNIFCMLLYTDITQWQSLLRILFLPFKNLL